MKKLSTDKDLVNPVCSTDEVFEVIRTERDYQRSMIAADPGICGVFHKSVGDYLTMMQGYLNRTMETWVSIPGVDETLKMMRKMAGIAVKCMEQHGAPPRDMNEVPSYKQRHAVEITDGPQSEKELKTDHDPTLIKKNIAKELWREYDWEVPGQDVPFRTCHRILAPRLLFMRPGGTTHRVVDANGVAHCLPAPGHMGCVLRWRNADKAEPVNF